jgi:putative redox protein
VADTREPVRIEDTGAGRFQVRITAGGESFIADEPASVGGLGSGPTPYELLSAGLGACTTMTLKLYAARKGWRLEQVAVEVVHVRDQGQTPPDRFIRRISLKGQLDAGQRDRLLEIADRCPVHETLLAGARFETVEVPLAGCADAEEHMGEMEKACED